MENANLLNQTGLIDDITNKTNYARTPVFSRESANNHTIKRLIAEGGEDFIRYLNTTGLRYEPGMLVLSSKYHYYYDLNELKCTTTLVILKKLNQIKHIESFVDALYHVLSPGANFIGCFHDINSRNDSGFYSRMYKGFLNFLDSKYEKEYDSAGISRLFESHGFKLLDMRVINGMTYFRTRNNRRFN
jgi:hypothetical protein